MSYFEVTALQFVYAAMENLVNEEVEDPSIGDTGHALERTELVDPWRTFLVCALQRRALVSGL